VATSSRPTARQELEPIVYFSVRMFLAVTVSSRTDHCPYRSLCEYCLHQPWRDSVIPRSSKQKIKLFYINLYNFLFSNPRTVLRNATDAGVLILNGVCAATLHVRSVPEDLYQEIQRLAGERSRSLVAQVVTMLAQASDYKESWKIQTKAWVSIRRRRFSAPKNRIQVSSCFMRIAGDDATTLVLCHWCECWD
jgi:hypothetical protein